VSTPIGALLAPAAQPVTVPYLTPAQFTAYPTWLDLANVAPGGLQSLQTDVLADVLLAASEWADSECGNMRLSAHFVSGENLTVRISGGRVVLQPRDVPCVAVTSLSWGWDPAALTSLTLAPGVLWNTDGRLVSFRPGGPGPVFTGPAIQFGASPCYAGPVYVTWSYVAGYVATTLPSGCSAGASSVTVADPTGVMPGQVLRIYDKGTGAAGGAGASEALTVAASYVPQVPGVAPVATSVPLAANTVYAHGNGTGITGMPRDMIQAVIAYAYSLLMREDVSGEAPPTGFGPAVRGDAGAGGMSTAAGLRATARGWLAGYKPVWR
jgi:hypothetical protein